MSTIFSNQTKKNNKYNEESLQKETIARPFLASSFAFSAKWRMCLNSTPKIKDKSLFLLT